MTAPGLIDTHCHLDFERFDEDREDVMSRAAVAGVGQIIVPALDLGNLAAVLALTEAYPGVYAAVGVHPNSTAAWQDDWLDALRAAAAHPKVVSIGEIGLDYYWHDSPTEMQHRAFSRQLELAAELGLPVIVHNREASEDVLRLLSESPLVGTTSPGVLHSFSGDRPTADAALALGYYIGVTGPVTYKKADELREIVAACPLERLLVETDAPFLAPHPHRGQRNEPAYVGLVADRLAEVRDMSVEAIAAATTANARRLFRLPGEEG